MDRFINFELWRILKRFAKLSFGKKFSEPQIVNNYRPKLERAAIKRSFTSGQISPKRFPRNQIDLREIRLKNGMQMGTQWTKLKSSKVKDPEPVSAPSSCNIHVERPAGTHTTYASYKVAELPGLQSRHMPRLNLETRCFF